MKRLLSAVLAILLAAAMLPLSLLPVSAETKAQTIEPYWTVPEGYNVHDYYCLRHGRRPVPLRCLLHDSRRQDSR